MNSAADAALPLNSDAMRLVAEIGFIGAETGQAAAARALFEALLILRPDSTLPHIGLALAALAADRPEDAVRMLRDNGLKQHAGDIELMAFMGLAMHAAGRPAQARDILQSVVDRAENSDEPCVLMARKLLESGAKAAAPAFAMPRWSAAAAR